MYECTRIIINFFSLFQWTLFNKGFVVEGRGGRGSLKSEWNRTGGGSQAYLYAHSVKKIAWFFKQQIEFLLIGCLVVAKSFIETEYTFF